MIEIIRGVTQKPVSTERLLHYLENKAGLKGIAYIGYPIVGTPAGAISLDAMVISPDYGVCVFDIEEGTQLTDRTELRDTIFNNLTAKLLQYKELVDKRNLKVPINVETYAPAASQNLFSEQVCFSDRNLDSFFDSHKITLDDVTYKHLVSVIQAVTKIKGVSKRTDVTKQNSKGAILKKLEASIANLDKYQNEAVIETVEGPQRIRGLAGSGKTIVLELKVAYLHSTHPEWDIAVTFNTRSLKNQFVDLITKFTIEHKNEEPDWNKIKILHGWGGPKVPGIYYDICLQHDVPYLDYAASKREFRITVQDSFDMVCQRALQQIKNFKQSYDVILIDETQDFSDSFLKLCYGILRSPKRLIWAYDELQKLNEATLGSTTEVVGGELRNEPGKPKQDIILEKCYRNSRPLLVTAQALGFGIYRKEGLVQMFDNPTIWKNIGYEIDEGELEYGNRVVLKRTDKTSPLFLEEHSSVDDLVLVKNFKNEIEQSQWVINEIIKNLKEDELEYKDIVVINSDPLTTEKATGFIRETLYKKNINTHVVGVTNSRDSFYEPDSIAFTGIFRAKGNEAPLVYIINSQNCYSGYELIKKRNILFTAITRSKAWVRICGFGKDMELLEAEIKNIKNKKFALDFTYPTLEQMKKLNVIHREMTRDERNKIENSNKSLTQVVQLLKEGTIKKEDLQQEQIDELRRLLDGSEQNT